MQMSMQPSVTARTSSTGVCFRSSSGGELPFKNLDYLYIPNIRKAVEDKQSEITAYVIKDGKAEEFKLGLGAMTDDEREIILKGCLINYYRG